MPVERISAAEGISPAETSPFVNNILAQNSAQQLLANKVFGKTTNSSVICAEELVRLLGSEGDSSPGSNAGND
jgi:hypothetical protein